MSLAIWSCPLRPWIRHAKQRPRRGFVNATCAEQLEARYLLSDFSVVPLWDGERFDPLDLTRNYFGGRKLELGRMSISHTTDTSHTGAGAYRIDTNGTIANGGFNFAQMGLTAGGSNNHIDTRSLAGYERIAFWIRNDTGTAFRLKFEVNDVVLSRVEFRFNIPATDGWTRIEVPLDHNGGQADLTRARLMTFGIEAIHGAVEGSFYIDDMVLIEPGGPVDSDTAPVGTLTERLAERMFGALWGSRDADSGLLPNLSSNASELALNSTAALLKVLPTAVQEGWGLSQAEADAYVSQIVGTLHTLMDQAQFLPSRYVERGDLVPTNALEESPADAAFMFLSLYQYKSLAATPAALKTQIDQLLARFNFAAFSSPAGWRHAYRIDTQDFTPGVYDGYSGEIWTISLAAHLVGDVDITKHFHSGVLRERDFLAKASQAHLVHDSEDFRAPFLQWLFPLFVDLSNRGVDTFPQANLASNPLVNAILYQRDVHDALEALGRQHLLQPDAGDDGSGAVYEQFSLYNNFGRPGLFMPWSGLFSFLAEPPVAEAALRNLIDHGLHGPFGLPDSIQWETGEATPERVTARNDLWNTSLSLMALTQHLFDSNKLLSSISAVRTALNKVYTLSLNGVTAAYQENGSPVAVEGSPSVTDPNSPDFDGGELRVSIIANRATGDQLALRSQGPISTSGNQVRFNGVAIGTFSGGTGTAPLVVVLNENSNGVNVAALIRSITFATSGDNPSTAQRILRFVLTDGDGGTSGPVNKQIKVVAKNDAPVVTLQGTVTYTEDKPPVILGQGAVIQDVDSPNFAGGRLVARFASGLAAGDRLTIVNQGTGAGQIGVSGNEVRFGGVLIGSFQGGVNAASLQIHLNENATVAAVQALARRIAYSSTSDNPGAHQRRIEILATDGDGGTSTPAVKTVNVVPVNDAPTIQLHGTVNYVASDPPVILGGAALLGDVDSLNFATGRLIARYQSGAEAGDRLTILHQGNSSGQIGVSGDQVRFGGIHIGDFQGGAGTTALQVHLNANATLAAVQALARRIAFRSVLADPGTQQRVIEFLATDGDGGTSVPAVKRVNVLSSPGAFAALDADHAFAGYEQWT